MIRSMAGAMLMLAPAPAVAQRVPVPVAEEAELKGLSADGAEIEARVNGDLNGDGEIDTAFIERGDDQRRLHVIIAYRDEFNLGHDPIGEYALDVSPLGPAEMTIRNGVLTVKDLTGGTDAIQATYRYRYDAKAKQMRLIGLDADAYSRNFQGDSFAISWNLLTGDYITRYSKLKPKGSSGDEAFEAPVERRRKRPSPPIFLDKTPSPEELVTAEHWPAG